VARPSGARPRIEPRIPQPQELTAIDNYECTVCGDCKPVCPTDSISLQGGIYVIDAERRNECAELTRSRAVSASVPSTSAASRSMPED